MPEAVIRPEFDQMPEAIPVRSRKCMWRCVAIITLAAVLITAPRVQAMSAGEWLDQCKIFIAIRAGEPIKPDAATKRILQACSLTAAQVWCAESYVVIGAKLTLPPGREHEITEALSKVCPHPLKQSHPVRYALEYWQQHALSKARRRGQPHPCCLKHLASVGRCV